MELLYFIGKKPIIRSDKQVYVSTSEIVRHHFYQTIISVVNPDYFAISLSFHFYTYPFITFLIRIGLCSGN